MEHIADLDALTRRCTGFRSFAALVAGGDDEAGNPVETGYFPALYPPPYSTAEMVAAYRALADAYDAAQTERGDRRRAYRSEAHTWQPGQGPGPAQEGYELYPIPDEEGDGYRVAVAGREIGLVLRVPSRQKLYRPTRGRQAWCPLHEAVRRLLRADRAERISATVVQGNLSL